MWLYFSLCYWFLKENQHSQGNPPQHWYHPTILLVLQTPEAAYQLINWFSAGSLVMKFSELPVPKPLPVNKNRDASLDKANRDSFLPPNHLASQRNNSASHGLGKELCGISMEVWGKFCVFWV